MVMLGVAVRGASSMNINLIFVSQTFLRLFLYQYLDSFHNTQPRLVRSHIANGHIRFGTVVISLSAAPIILLS